MALLLREIPKDDCLRALAKEYRELEPSAVETHLTLLRVAGDVLNAFEMHFARHHLSQGRFGVLAILKISPGHQLHAAGLAEKIGVSRATMTGLLDGLERDGLIARLGEQADRRKTMIKLTLSGQRYLERILPDHFRRVAKLMAELGEGERKNLIRLLQKVAHGIPALIEPSDIERAAK
jgi:DNA-binding MarR family transcriptional regulator